MTTNDPQIAPEVSSPTQDTTQSQHVGEKTTHPERPERRDSRFGHVVETIRHSFSIERKGSHHEAHLAKVREQDKYDRARAAEEMMWESVQAKESTSPAVEARKSFDLNENNMGADSEERKEKLGLAGVGND